jgi:hypothetical protein
MAWDGSRAAVNIDRAFLGWVRRNTSDRQSGVRPETGADNRRMQGNGPPKVTGTPGTIEPRYKMLEPLSNDQSFIAGATALQIACRRWVGDEVFSSWFASLRCERIDADQLVLSAPTNFHCKFIEREYGEMLRGFARQAFAVVKRVRVVLREHPGGLRKNEATP